KSGDGWTFVTGLTKIPTSFSTYGADTVLLFRKDCAIGTSKYDLDSIGEGRTLIFDLDGNTLDITNGDRYNAMTTSAGKNISFVLKNGRVYSNGKASLVCIYARGNNTVNLTFEKLNITLGADFGETQVLVRHGYDEAPTHKATFNITLNDCNVDISAVSDPSSINAFSVGYTADRGNYELNWRINGGSLDTGASAFSATHLRVVKAGNLVLGKGSDGEYLKMIYTADLDNGISAGFTDESGNARYFGAVSIDGTNYIHQPLILETAYGSIPKDKVSALKYPFVSFYNGKARKADDLFANVNIEYDLRSLDGAVIVMRRDYSVPSGKIYQNLSHHQGTLIIDLCGFTLNGNDSAYDGIFQATGMNTFTTNLVVKNGKIVTDGFIFSVAARSGVADKTQGFTFEDVVIESSATALFKYATPASNSTININFDDCIINSDTLASTATLFLAGYSASDTYLTANVTVRGGVFTLGKFNQTKFVSEQNGGTLKFLAGKNGRLPTVYVPTGTSMSGTAYKGDGDVSLYLVEYANGETYDEYRVESLVTPYGTIAYANSSRVDYPFLAFKDNGDGTYTYFTKSTDFFKNGGMEWEIRDKGYASVVVLMRRDFHAENSNSNLGLNANRLTIDLGGFTLTSANSTGAICMYAKNATTTPVTIKNGTIVLGKYSFMTFESNSGGAGKIFNLTLENLRFEYTNGATATAPYKFNNVVGAFTVNLDINNCTYDFSANRPERITVFVSGESSGKVSFTTNIVGGSIMLDSFNGVTISNSPANLVFKPGENGEYTTFILPVGQEAITDGFVSDRGSLTLVKTNSDGAFATFSLRDADRLVSPKGSLTLYSDFVYNLYIPIKDSVLAITLGGVKYDLNSLTVVNVDGIDYYHIAWEIPVSSACNVYTLEIEVEYFEGKVQTLTWNIGVISYAKILIDGNYTNIVKTLAKDILSYIRATYIYAQLDDNCVAEIDAIIGKDYEVTSAPDTNVESAFKVDGLSSATLELGEAPAFRFYIDGTYDASAYRFTVNGKTVKGEILTDEESKVYIKVSLYAYEMTEIVSYTVDGTDISGEYNLKAYYNFAVSTGDATLVKLVERLWKYSEVSALYRVEATA
ncbi:MAG: hypothetical protein IKV43_01880, partial [Clostridia bacterium]|nr:hypothetical protein [Clostridia bacterium]